MKKVTEETSHYDSLESQSTEQLISWINDEDKKVADVVGNLLPLISKLVDAVCERMKDGGRLFYIGAGTSGRLGILDASECPPTFGVPHDWVIGLMAGGDAAIRKAVEFAEDDDQQAILDLESFSIDERDVVIGIAASGTTPYVIGGLRDCQKKGILTGCITCNPGAPVVNFADHPLVAVVGPEFITGSTRMKSGTAQKMILNMISTTCMIKLGRVKGNKMVDMQLANNKLVDRGTRLVMDASNLSYEEARQHLLAHDSVRQAIETLNKDNQ